MILCSVASKWLSHSTPAFERCPSFINLLFESKELWGSWDQIGKKKGILVSLLSGSPLNTTVLFSFTTYLCRALHKGFLYLDILLTCFLVLWLFAVTCLQARDLWSAYLFKYQSVSINNPLCIKLFILKVRTKQIFSSVFSLTSVSKTSPNILHQEQSFKFFVQEFETNFSKS